MSLDGGNKGGICQSPFTWLGEAGHKTPSCRPLNEKEKYLPTAFAHSLLLSKTFFSLGHEGGWAYSSESPTPCQAQGRWLFPNIVSLFTAKFKGRFTDFLQPLRMWEAALESRLVSVGPVRHIASRWLSLLQALWSRCHPCLSGFGLSSSSGHIVNDSNGLHQQVLNLSILLSRKEEETNLFIFLGWQRTETNCKKEQYILWHYSNPEA